MVILLFGAGHLRVTHPFATLPPRRIQGFPFDLHVLGTPPAFILSQDQTLRKFTFRVYLQARLGTQSICLSSYHSSVVKVLPKRRRSIARPFGFVKSGVTCVHCREALFPDLPSNICLSRGKKGLYHNPCILSNRDWPVTWQQSNQQILMPICWQLGCAYDPLLRMD